jgi:hypothetical protein
VKADVFTFATSGRDPSCNAATTPGISPRTGNGLSATCERRMTPGCARVGRAAGAESHTPQTGNSESSVGHSKMRGGSRHCVRRVSELERRYPASAASSRRVLATLAVEGEIYTYSVVTSSWRSRRLLRQTQGIRTNTRTWHPWRYDRRLPRRAPDIDRPCRARQRAKAQWTKRAPFATSRRQSGSLAGGAASPSDAHPVDLERAARRVA